MRMAPRVAEFALVALLGVLIAKILLALFAPLPLPKGDRLAAANGGARKVETQLVVANPFPANAAATTGPVDAAPDVAETTLDLTLTGVFPDDIEGSAIIETSDGKQKRFAVGDDIEASARLAAVYSDQVIIERNGLRESLRFEHKADAVQPAPTAQPAESAIGDMFLVQQDVDDAGDPAFRLFAGSNGTLFTQFGFEDGDILKSINGAPVAANASAVMALVDAVSKGATATVVIERDGAPRVLTLSLSKVGNN